MLWCYSNYNTQYRVLCKVKGDFMKTIAEIGNDRLINVLVKDKNQSPSKVINILKSEITEILTSYTELDDEIIIAMKTERGRISFEIKAVANRIKDFGQIAE